MTSCIITDRIIRTATLRGGKSDFRAGTAWAARSPLERGALLAMRRVFTGRLSGPHADAWMKSYPGALGRATDAEARLLRMADCAVEYEIRA